VPDVPAEVRWPRNTWPDPATYDRQARNLAGMFAENFTAYSDRVGAEVRAAAPTGM
jgi:phosphoenolpyruvate carboxykinase (ATP)